MTKDREGHQVDDVEYLRRREADERAAAEDAACMARTAHEDLADQYAERAAAVNQASMEARVIHERLLSQIDAEDRS
jgi:hypothetical protein